MRISGRLDSPPNALDAATRLLRRTAVTGTQVTPPVTAFPPVQRWQAVSQDTTDSREPVLYTRAGATVATPTTRESGSLIDVWV